MNASMMFNAGWHESTASWATRLRVSRSWSLSSAGYDNWMSVASRSAPMAGFSRSKWIRRSFARRRGNV